MITRFRDALIFKFKSTSGVWGVLRKLFYGLLYFSGLPFFFREILQRNKVTILLYHKIEPGLFDQHITAFKKRYNIVSLNNYLLSRKSGQSLPPKSLIITIDDGYSSNYHLLPVIKKYKIPVTIFLCSAIVDTHRKFWGDVPVSGYNSFSQLRKISDSARLKLLKQHGFEEENEYAERSALSRAEIQEMSAYVDFQSHTRFHPSLTHCGNQRAANEIRESRRELNDKFNFNINAFAYPFGDYSERDVNLVKEAGYEVAITADHYFNDLKTDLYRLRRLGIPDNAGVYEALVNASGLKMFLRKCVGKLNYGYANTAIDEIIHENSYST